MKLLAVALLALPTPALAQGFVDGRGVSDPELATMRGGYVLPGGVQVAIGVAIETRVDGALALRTTLNGTGVTVDAGSGTPSINRAGGTTIAQLAGQGISISQLVGRATATIIANTGNDRVIDTSTTVAIDLSGPLLPSNFISNLESATRGVTGY